MSDADRLRAAADRLDDTWPGLELSDVADEVAALLRAIADDHAIDDASLGGPVWWRTAQEAHALADVILGPAPKTLMQVFAEDDPCRT